MQTLRDKTVVLGICGSIAAYKSLLLTRLLVGAGAQVWPVLTAGAQRFVTPLSLATLALRPAITDLWQATSPGEIDHVELAHRADAIVVAPATAHSLARLSLGLADDALGALVLASRAPLLVAPAMESGMWDNAATQELVPRLQARGARVVVPPSGPLASGRTGVGRMAEPATLLELLQAALRPQDWAGEAVVVTAGPTREYLDPARFLSNPSTGKMGFALARAAQSRGAQVHLISGPTALAPPAGVAYTAVTTAEEMLAACQAALPGCTALLMAAAPADYRPTAYSLHKGKKQPGPLNVALTRTPDILVTLAARTPQRLVLGFAAETEEVAARGQEKLARKDLDVLFANPVGVPDAGFVSDTNAGWLLCRNAPPAAVAKQSKEALAHLLLDALRARRQAV